MANTFKDAVEELHSCTRDSGLLTVHHLDPPEREERLRRILALSRIITMSITRLCATESPIRLFAQTLRLNVMYNLCGFYYEGQLQTAVSEYAGIDIHRKIEDAVLQLAIELRKMLQRGSQEQKIAAFWQKLHQRLLEIIESSE